MYVMLKLQKPKNHNCFLSQDPPSHPEPLPYFSPKTLPLILNPLTENNLSNVEPLSSTITFM